MQGSNQQPTKRTAWLVVIAFFVFAVFCGIIIGIFIQATTAIEKSTITPGPVQDKPVAIVTDRVPGILKPINDYRAGKNLTPLKLNGELSNSAQAKSDDLVQHHYWAHFRDGATPWDFISQAGYKYERAGENLAKCYPDATSIVFAWINSPAHEAVLTGNYQEAGFGITWNEEDHCNYVVGHFGTEEVELPAAYPTTGVAR